jgi:hypothetical protein
MYAQCMLHSNLPVPCITLVLCAFRGASCSHACMQRASVQLIAFTVANRCTYQKDTPPFSHYVNGISGPFGLPRGHHHLPLLVVVLSAPLGKLSILEA